MKGRRKPDHEAESIVVKANRITNQGYFHRSNTHGGNRMVAKGDVEVEIKKQHPGNRDKGVRPDPGTTLIGPGGDTEVTIEARRPGRINRVPGRDIATASKGVRIFGKLRRSKE